MPAATATASDRKSRAAHWPASASSTAPTQPQPTTTPGTRGSVTCVVATETSFVSTGSSLAAVSLAVLTSAASRLARADDVDTDARAGRERAPRAVEPARLTRHRLTGERALRAAVSLDHDAGRQRVRQMNGLRIVRTGVCDRHVVGELIAETDVIGRLHDNREVGDRRRLWRHPGGQRLDVRLAQGRGERRQLVEIAAVRARPVDPGAGAHSDAKRRVVVEHRRLRGRVGRSGSAVDVERRLRAGAHERDMVPLPVGDEAVRGEDRPIASVRVQFRARHAVAHAEAPEASGVTDRPLLDDRLLRQ